MTKSLSATALILIAGGILRAHEPITTKLTWSRDISPIVFKHCAGCHRRGSSAPMSLLNYEEVRPWAKAIKEEVRKRRMPPWGAVKGFGDFDPDLSLSQEEVHRILDWVEGGAPEGDPTGLPSLPSRDQPKQVAGKKILLSKRLLLDRSLTLAAIQPGSESRSVQVMLERQDGSREPLLWLYNYDARWNGYFIYRSPLQLPKGTVIISQPAATLWLIEAPPPVR